MKYLYDIHGGIQQSRERPATYMNICLHWQILIPDFDFRKFETNPDSFNMEN